MVPFSLVLGCYAMLVVNYYPMKDIIGVAGCYVLELVELYGIITFQSISFYTSLFRYMCIVLHDKMRQIGLSPMVRSIRIMILIQ